MLKYCEIKITISITLLDKKLVKDAPVKTCGANRIYSSGNLFYQACLVSIMPYD